jgi:hypothetical protein
MGVGTVFLIPSNIEPLCWLVVFLISAYAIARYGTGSPFLHGVFVGLANSVWVTGAHVLLFSQYVARHQQEVHMMASWPLAKHPRLLMLLIGPTIGLVSGIVLGIFAVVASKVVAPETKRAVA